MQLVTGQNGVSDVMNVKLYTFSGTHREMGVQQGEASRRLVKKALEELPKYESVKAVKPKLLPDSLFLVLAKRRAAKLMKNDIFTNYPRQAERLTGIAEGTQTSEATILFLMSIELMSALRESDYRLEACTSIGISPKHIATQETIVAKNFDYPAEYAPYQLTSLTEPSEGYQTLGCTMAPLPGMLDGMNEHGLTVTYNFPVSKDVPSNSVPLSMVLQEMLESCRSVDEAASFLSKSKRGGQGGLLTLADAEGKIVAMEITSNNSAIRQMTEGYIINTNSFQTAEMQQYEIPHNAVFKNSMLPVATNLRVHESSEQRYKRAEALLKTKENKDENKIIAIMRDHGQENKPSVMTICKHSPSPAFVPTLRSMILFPARRSLSIIWKPMPKPI
jgi:predicted choloylglycine hydrolase